MPIPKPDFRKTEQKFISDCMGDESLNKDFPNQKQRYAVCKTTFDRAKKAKASEGEDCDVNWLDMKDDSYIMY
jgi:hypothetical protein